MLSSRRVRALLVGWFSLPSGGATAGDLAALGVVRGWLEEAGIEHEQALGPPLGEGPDWSRLDPGRFSHVIFVCGPLSPRLEAARILERFQGCRLIAVNTSMTTHPGVWNPFDTLLERDSELAARPDLAFAGRTAAVPVVGVVLAHLQREHPRPLHDRVDALVRALVAERDLTAVPIDTTLYPSGAIPQSVAQVTSLIARMDVVVTTRLHGMVFALRAGVPAVALDPIPGGAKVARQAGAVGWPHAETAERLDGQRLAELFDACLAPEARALARSCAARARAEVDGLRPLLVGAVAGSTRAR